jgi:WD40 repeat protein
MNTAAISPDGLRLATGADDGTLCLYDLRTGGLLHSTSAHSRVVTGIDFSPSGASVVSGSEDAFVKIWKASDLSNEAVLRGHVLGVHSVAFSPDGRRVISGSHNEEAIKIWDVSTHQELITLQGVGSFFRGARFSTDGKIIGAVNSEGILHFWSGEIN